MPTAKPSCSTATDNPANPAVLLGAAVMAVTGRHLTHIDDPEDAADELADEAAAVTVGN